jgi:hypothetical protein
LSGTWGGSARPCIDVAWKSKSVTGVGAKEVFRQKKLDRVSGGVVAPLMALL